MYLLQLRLWVSVHVQAKMVAQGDTVILHTSRGTWKIHELKNHLATLPEVRSVTLSIDRPLPSSQPRLELLRADWSPMHFERLRLPFSNKKSSDSSVGEEKC